MTLHVIRHGETEFNAQQRYAGSTDVPLNQTGREQAKKIAFKLASVRFDVIVSSPLRRALETAEIIKADHPFASLVVMEEFAERCMGVYEGLTRNEVQNKYPDLWSRRCTAQLDDAPTNGETIRQLDDRIAEGLRKIVEQYADQTVLLVCHGFVSRAINRRINHLPFEQMHRFSLDNCQVATYTL